MTYLAALPAPHAYRETLVATLAGDARIVHDLATKGSSIAHKSHPEICSFGGDIMNEAMRFPILFHI